jgi:hypothetical protein
LIKLFRPVFLLFGIVLLYGLASLSLRQSLAGLIAWRFVMLLTGCAAWLDIPIRHLLLTMACGLIQLMKRVLFLASCRHGAYLLFA